MSTVWRAMGSGSGPLLGFLSGALTPLKAKQPQQLTPRRAPPPQQPTSLQQIEQILKGLDGRKKQWVALGCKERAHLLRECLSNSMKRIVLLLDNCSQTAQGCLQVAEAAAEESAKAKGNLFGEELVGWVPVVTLIRELAEAMEADGQPKPFAVKTRPDGQKVVDVWPLGVEGMIYGGFRGDVWIRPGEEATQGCLYREKAKGKVSPGAVSLVLGAGNQLPVVAGDILHKLVLEDEVVVCKMNPVNEYLGPHIRRAFAPLVDAGFLEIVYGGAEQGAFLVNHPTVKSIHLTGSAATYDAIVWGPGKPKTGTPALTKPVAAELGCVTPCLVVPGGWTQRDLEYHADNIVSAKSHNAGHNCLAAEVIITAKDWPQREAFLDALRRRLDREPQRVPWYPGSDKRQAAFRQKFATAEAHGSDQAVRHEGVKAAPWLLQAGLSPDKADLSTENWCGVLQEVALPGTGADPAAFMDQAVAFANDRIWGTLSCCIFVPDEVQKQHPQAFDRTIANLKYGSINVNVCNIIGYAVSRLTWGAFPGHTMQDIGSGNCAVHNSMLLDHVQKSVVYGPWQYPLTPFTSSQNRNLVNLAHGSLAFFARPNLATLNAAAIAALMG